MFDCYKIKNREFMQCIIIVLAVFVMAGMLFFIRFFVQSNGAWVVITLDGQEMIRYNIMEDGTYTIEGKGTDFNVLVIREGTAFIEEANCQNQVCVHSKPISYTGETITCLPHRIQVSIEGGEKQEYDTITN